jgi:hypothetical protein
VGCHVSIDGRARRVAVYFFSQEHCHRLRVQQLRVSVPGKVFKLFFERLADVIQKPLLLRGGYIQASVR